MSEEMRPYGAKLLVVATLALAGALLLARHAASANAQPCWGDIAPTAYVASPDDVAHLPALSSLGPRTRPGVAALGELELHFVPIYHRFGDTDEIGWAGASIVDPSSCSERAIPLDLGDRAGTSLGPITLARDPVRDIYVISGEQSVLAAYRRRPAPGMKHHWAGLAPAFAFDAASALVLLIGAAKVLRAQPAEALLGISLLLSVLGAIFGLSG